MLQKLLLDISHTFSQIGFRGRIWIVFVVCWICVLVAIFKLFSWQIVQGGQWAAFSQGWNQELKEIVPPRGNIYIQDSAGQRNHLVATDKPALVLGADPKEIVSPAVVLNNLDLGLGAEEYNALYRRLGDETKNFVEIADKLNQEDRREIESKELQGIEFQASSFRYYPSGSLASHVIGFLGYIGEDGDWEGGAGVEAFFAEEPFC